VIVLLAAVVFAMCSIWLLRGLGASTVPGDRQGAAEVVVRAPSEAASRFTILVTATVFAFDPDAPAGKAALKVMGDEETGILAEAEQSELLPPLRLGGVLSAPRVMTFSGQACTLELTSVAGQNGSRSLKMDVLAEILSEDRVLIDAQMKLVEMRGPVDEFAERAGVPLAPRGAQAFEGPLDAGQSVFIRERVGASEFVTLLRWELTPIPDPR
jgi:hypothetical protein